MNTGHPLKVDFTFKVIYKVNRKLPKEVIFHLPSITEALARHLEKPELSVRKELIQLILLLWSQSLVNLFFLDTSFTDILFLNDLSL